MRCLLCFLCALSLGCDKNPKPTPTPTSTKPATKKQPPPIPKTTPLPTVDPGQIARVEVQLSGDFGLVLEAPMFASDPNLPPKPKVYLTHKGGVLETLQQTWFDMGKDTFCEELDVDAALIDLGGAKAARLTVGCRAGEDSRSTTEHTAILGIPKDGTPITSLATLTPRWMGVGGQVDSLMMAECVTTLTASFKLEGDEIVITRTPKAIYSPPEDEQPSIEEKDCVAPKASGERAPWK